MCSDRVDISRHELGLEISAGAYRLVLSHRNGYAVRSLYTPAESRFNLTRFDNAGEGPHPTCMFFDNLNVNECLQQAFYGRSGETTAATVVGNVLSLSGHLIPNRDGVGDEALFHKTMSFDERGYRAAVALDLTSVEEVNYVSVFWDVNDRWVRWMRDSSGVFLPLTVSVGDSFGDSLADSFHSFRDLGTMPSGEACNVWMEMGGDSQAVRITLIEPEALSPELKWGGMKFWDGPDDCEEGFGVSHSCPNLDIINTRLAGSEGFRKPERIEFSYRVDLIPAIRYRWGKGETE